jgi:hypothetical protein
MTALSQRPFLQLWQELYETRFRRRLVSAVPARAQRRVDWIVSLARSHDRAKECEALGMGRFIVFQVRRTQATRR